MAEANFDPVPSELVLHNDTADEIILPRFIGSGIATPAQLALAALYDHENLAAKLMRFPRNQAQFLGENPVNLFRSMKVMAVERNGTHVHHVIAAACLHPARHTPIEFEAAATWYLSAHGSREPDILDVRMAIGTLSMDGLMEEESYTQRFLSGEQVQVTSGR